MIIDSSAVIAIVRHEPERDRFLEVLDGAGFARISAASYLEAAIVTDGSRDPVLSNYLDQFLESAQIEIEPVTASQARIAREAYRGYGKGSGHPAQLNFGDCFAYALARDLREPLLYKGADFSHTDIASALQP
jgi:ribonuclease VapC